MQVKLSKNQRRAVRDGTSVEVTGQVTGPDTCPSCLDWVVYWLDPEGLWAECACDGGYIR